LVSISPTCQPLSLVHHQSTVCLTTLLPFVYGPHGPHFEGANLTMMGISLAVGVFGFAVAYSMYVTRTLHFNKTFAEAKEGMAQLVSTTCHSTNGIWMTFTSVSSTASCYLGYNKVWTAVDKNFIEGIVNGAGLVTMSAGEVLKFLQNGRGQYYALVIFAAVAGIAWISYIFPGH
jgi:NAD(P)H-quinone oxidoreductase subunit 5